MKASTSRRQEVERQPSNLKGGVIRVAVDVLVRGRRRGRRVLRQLDAVVPVVVFGFACCCSRQLQRVGRGGPER